jgi:transglutaminase-like putative cysteine protease
MQIEICHITEYKYSNPIFLEPHHLRLKPKPTPYSSLSSFYIDIEPKPKGLSTYHDVENNDIHFCWFEDLHQNLKVTAKSLINVTEYNPFNFLIHPSEFLKITFEYNQKDQQLLKAYTQTSTLPKVMKTYLDDILKAVNHQTIDLLTTLTTSIHKEYTVETREEGVPNDIEFTFKQKKGSCRDLVWMQIHLLRTLGIAARFVSGYFYIKAEKPQFELHAWLEVYIPGAGWIGFDPSHGMITGCYHIPLASSAFYENTMPVSGSIRGKATTTLKYDLDIILLE